MNIGILTFHRANNYGAVLQAYGLQYVLKQLGHNVSILDYCPPYISDNYRSFNLLNKYNIRHILTKQFIKDIFKTIIKIKRNYGFNRFRNKYLNIQPIETINQNQIVIVGSDQIWAPRITGGHLDKMFFLETYKGRKIAYAASAGDDNFIKDYINEEIKILLTQFHAISVRETFLKDILTENQIHDVETVADPVIIAGKNAFDELTDIKYKPKESYILSFSLGYYPDMVHFSDKLGRERCMKVIHLSSADLSLFGNIQNTAGIKKFLTLIKYAHEVITYSFHGTVLSTLFNKDFWYIDIWNNKSSRIFNYLTQIGLDHRYTNGTNLPTYQKINYSGVNVKIENIRQNSKQFLMDAIK